MTEVTFSYYVAQLAFQIRDYEGGSELSTFIGILTFRPVNTEDSDSINRMCVCHDLHCLPFVEKFNVYQSGILENRVWHKPVVGE